MTHVQIKHVGEKSTIICEGHATGSREMCAAVSCLVYSTIGWLNNSDCIHAEQIKPGYAEISFAGKGTDVLCQFLTVGFLQLEQYDSEHISVEITP